MHSSIFYKYEKYWRKRRVDKNNTSGLELFDIRCLAQSLLTDEERQQMDDYLFHEQFLQILQEAIKRNDTEQLHETLHESKLNLNFFSLDGLTPLHIVCKLGHNEILQLLLQRGAQCNIVDRRHGHSPLQVAAMNGHHSCVATLLQNNANICYANTETNSKTALHFACENGNLMCIKELLISRELNIVKKNEITKVIQTTLIMQDINGHTPLHLAVIDGNQACVKLLLEAGTNANIVNTEGRTALALALQMGNEQIAAILKPYTSESLPATPLPAQQTQQHPYTAMQSPSSPNGTSFSFSEAVDAESVGLFEGCSIVYENSSSSSGISSKMRYVIACKEHLVEEEEGGSGKIVVCTTRELAETVAEKFSRQTEVHLRSSHTSVLKSDMMGSTMNNNSNIFSSGSSGVGEWGRRRSLEARSNSSEDIGKNYKRWAVSNVPVSAVGVTEAGSSSRSISGGSDGSGRVRKCVVVEVPAIQLVSLSDSVLYEGEASLLASATPKNGNSSGSATAAEAKFISQQLEAEDPMWEQFKRQHSKNVVVVTSLD